MRGINPPRNQRVLPAWPGLKSPLKMSRVTCTRLQARIQPINEFNISGKEAAV